MDRGGTADTALSEMGQNWEVFDADGEKVGDVNEVHSNYIWVQNGLLFPQDMYIPVTAIHVAEDGRVQLAVRADQIRAAGWDVLPQTLGGA